jgi:hypothetical protein
MEHTEYSPNNFNQAFNQLSQSLDVSAKKGFYQGGDSLDTIKTRLINVLYQNFNPNSNLRVKFNDELKNLQKDGYIEEGHIKHLNQAFNGSFGKYAQISQLGQTRLGISSQVSDRNQIQTRIALLKAPYRIAISKKFFGGNMRDDRPIGQVIRSADGTKYSMTLSPNLTSVGAPRDPKDGPYEILVREFDNWLSHIENKTSEESRKEQIQPAFVPVNEPLPTIKFNTAQDLREAMKNLSLSSFELQNRFSNRFLEGNWIGSSNIKDIQLMRDNETFKITLEQQHIRMGEVPKTYSNTVTKQELSRWVANIGKPLTIQNVSLGSLDRESTEKRLLNQPSGSWLVRYSESQRLYVASQVMTEADGTRKMDHKLLGPNVTFEDLHYPKYLHIY